MQNLPPDSILSTFTAKSNFFKVQAHKKYFKYKCTLSPLEKSDDQLFQFQRLIRQKQLQNQLRQCFGPHLALNFQIYTEKSDQKNQEFSVTLDEQEYKFTTELIGQITDENQGELFGFYGRTLKEMQRQLKMIRIQGKYFFRKSLAEIPNNYLKIYQGYQSSLRTMGATNRIYASIDPVYKICNTRSLNEFMQNYIKQYNQEKLANYLQGQIVMTNYPPIRMWRIDGLRFDLTPQSMFKRKEQEITYIDYYKKFHNLEIQCLDQPLIQNKDRKTGREIFLIPEFLQLTGLDEKTRSNFHITKEIDKYTKPTPSQRYFKTKELIQQINKCENSNKSDQQQQQQIEEENYEQQVRKAYQSKYIDFLQGVQIKEEAESFEGRIINGGQFLLGNGQSVSTRDNLDRNMQRSLYQSQQILRWAVFVQGDEENQAYKLFSENIIQAARTYCVTLPAPAVRFLKTNNIQQWSEGISKYDGSNLLLIVIILQGEKKQAPLYNELKRILISEKGIASQIILQKTLLGKGIRSICNKILIQMVAKTGGFPWIINQMPFRDQPTMIVGIDVYHRTFAGKRKSVYAFVATMDFRFALYFSMVRIQQPGEEIGMFVEECQKLAIAKFKAINKQYSPVRIIVYRDGVSEGQRSAVKAIEIPAIRRATTAMGCENTKLVFITVDKKANAKFYDSSSQYLQNCQPGSIIDNQEICSEEEFYLISAKVNAGIAQPVHYFILEDDLIIANETQAEKTEYKQMIEIFTFKLCHLYYNWTGSIKVPAPCIYAHKLSNLVGDKWGDASQFTVSKQLQERCSLYYI